MDAAAAGESTPSGTFSWFGIAGTWFWIDPVNDLAFVGMIQHSGRAAAEVRGRLAQSRVSGAHEVVRAFRLAVSPCSASL